MDIKTGTGKAMFTGTGTRTGPRAIHWKTDATTLITEREKIRAEAMTISQPARVIPVVIHHTMGVSDITIPRETAAPQTGIAKHLPCRGSVADTIRAGPIRHPTAIISTTTRTITTTITLRTKYVAAVAAAPRRKRKSRKKGERRISFRYHTTAILPRFPMMESCGPKLTYHNLTRGMTSSMALKKYWP